MFNRILSFVVCNLLLSRVGWYFALDPCGSLKHSSDHLTVFQGAGSVGKGREENEGREERKGGGGGRGT